MRKSNLLLLLILLSVSSCLKYNDLQGNDPNLDGTIAQKIDNSAKDYFRGKSCVTNVLGLVAIGDSSLETAKNKGHIGKVAYSYTTYKSFTYILPWFQTGCTIAVGEENQHDSY